MLERCRVETYSLDEITIAYETVDDSEGPYVKWDDLLPLLRAFPLVEGPIRVGEHLGQFYISLDGHHLEQPVHNSKQWMEAYAELLRLRQQLDATKGVEV